MKRFLAVSTLAVVVSLSPELSGYQFYDVPVPKWGGGAVGTPSGDITWLFGTAGTPDMAGGDPVLLDGEFAVLIGCLQDWESATNGNLDLHYIGTSSAAIVTGDGNHIARWEETTFPSFGGSVPGGVIGICTFDYSGSTLLDADVEFNGVGFTWGDPVRMKKVALHEFGHAVAFAHESATVGGVPISAGGVPISIMYPSVSDVTDLTTDDKAGAIALYGWGGGTDGIVETGPPVPPPPPFSHPPRRSDPVDPSGTRSPNFKSSNHKSSSDDGDDYGHGIRRYKNKYCVVATAACGSENASRVDLLRAMRDRSLKATVTGASAVSTYENAAAPVAQVVQQSEVLRALVRGALSR